MRLSTLNAKLPQNYWSRWVYLSQDRSKSVFDLKFLFTKVFKKSWLMLVLSVRLYNDKSPNICFFPMHTSLTCLSFQMLQKLFHTSTGHQNRIKKLSRETPWPCKGLKESIYETINQIASSVAARWCSRWLWWLCFNKWYPIKWVKITKKWSFWGRSH